MAARKTQLAFLGILLFTGALPARAQLAPSEPDPLERIRDAAKSNVEACSATGETLCEQVAPKIVANAEHDSALAANLKRLAEAVGHSTPAAWALQAFQDANVSAHIEKYSALPDPSRVDPGVRYWETVVGEIRGREKPDEWILLGTRLGAAPTLEQAYNAALVIEAARDIQLTGIHPRRSIRFVLFGDFHGRTDGAWIRMHREELDRACAAIIYEAAAHPVDGLALNGRRDIEPGVREALQPIYAMGVTHHTFDAPFDPYSLDFILQGIPTLLAPSREGAKHSVDLITASRGGLDGIGDLQRNTAILAVTAFGIAERAEPIGPRQSRAEIDTLLKASGLQQEMKAAVIWPLWESGERGRTP